MPLTDLDVKEREVVWACLKAAVEGPFFPDWEFHTLFGLERTEVKDVLDSWPDLDESKESVALAINNTLVNLLGYPHDCGEQWSQFISVTELEVARILDKWRGKPIRNYFDGLM